MQVREIETRLGLHPNVLYMVMAIEKKIAEFETKNLVELSNRLQQIEQARQEVIASINQVNGAIIGGKIMIDEELQAAGATREQYEEEKALFLKELEEKKKEKEQELESGRLIQLVTPQEAQNNETIQGTNDNSGRGVGQ